MAEAQIRGVPGGRKIKNTELKTEHGNNLILRGKFPLPKRSGHQDVECGSPAAIGGPHGAVLHPLPTLLDVKIWPHHVDDAS